MRSGAFKDSPTLRTSLSSLSRKALGAVSVLAGVPRGPAGPCQVSGLLPLGDGRRPDRTGPGARGPVTRPPRACGTHGPGRGEWSRSVPRSRLRAGARALRAGSCALGDPSPAECARAAPTPPAQPRAPERCCPSAAAPQPSRTSGNAGEFAGRTRKAGSDGGPRRAAAGAPVPLRSRPG